MVQPGNGAATNFPTWHNSRLIQGLDSRVVGWHASSLLQSPEQPTLQVRACMQWNMHFDHHHIDACRGRTGRLLVPSAWPCSTSPTSRQPALSTAATCWLPWASLSVSGCRVIKAEAGKQPLPFQLRHSPRGSHCMWELLVQQEGL